MKKKLLIAFLVYSYTTNVLYVASESLLKVAKEKRRASENGVKMNVKMESTLKAAISNFREAFKIM